MAEALPADRLYTFARLLAPSPQAARRAVTQALDSAQERGHLRPHDPELAWAWLARLALHYLRPRTSMRPDATFGSVRATPDLETLRRALNRLGPSVVALWQDPSDATLLILVRTLPSEERAALVLGLLYAVPQSAAADALGLSDARFRHLSERALGGVHRKLSHHSKRQLHSASLAARIPPRLRPLPLRPDGVVVVRGPRVYVDPDAPAGPVGALLRLLAGLQRLLSGALCPPDPTDDDAGETHNHQPLAPTPTAQPISRPRLTPSMEPYRMPKPTSGTAVHRTAPHGTPSIRRLPARPRPTTP